VAFVNGVHATGTVQGTATILPGSTTAATATTAGSFTAPCTATVITDCTVPNATVGTGNYYLLVPGVDLASVPKGYLGEPIFQHGLFLEIRGSQAGLGAKGKFLQLHLQLERVVNLAPKWHLLLRDELGATFVSNLDQVPPAMRFFAGGEGSVRGFAYNDLSPQQTFCNPIVYKGGEDSQCIYNVKAGGKNLITGSVEFDRDLPRNFGVAAFFDYGNAFNHFGAQCALATNVSPPRQDCRGLLEYGAGIGFRVRLPVLTLGIDIGQPLSQSGSPRLYINFSPKL
jgi:translocation and assembly module TamA